MLCNHVKIFQWSFNLTTTATDTTSYKDDDDDRVSLSKFMSPQENACDLCKLNAHPIKNQWYQSNDKTYRNARWLLQVH